MSMILFFKLRKMLAQEIIKNTKVYIENIDKKQNGCNGSASSLGLLMLSTLAIVLLKNKKK